MATPPPITWQLPGYPDDVALCAAGGRLFAAASTATLESEDVWFGEVTSAGITGVARVVDDGPSCRPALAVLDDGSALAIACMHDRLAAVFADGTGGTSRWQHALDGIPLHVSATAIGRRVWIAIEIARAAERYVRVIVVDPASGAVDTQHAFGGGATWCRWPVIERFAGEPVIAWCEGPARMPGLVKIARCTAELAVCSVSIEPGEAPALARLPDGAIAIAWHHGGAFAGGDDRDASVARGIDVAIVRLGAGHVVATSPPPGAGGSMPRGEDQGWELPALAAGGDGSLWLVGRSTHGHQLARRNIDGAWTAPLPLDEGGWGGRGRRHALLAHAGELWLARRSPSGVLIGVCPEPSRAVARASSWVTAVPRPRTRRENSGVLFGDLHQHTAHSDGCGSVEDLWIAARDRRGLDFAAITDHDQFCRRALGPATWQIATSTAAAFDEPGRFVAIAGYEFTGPRHPGPGHKCVYFGDRVPPRVPDRDVDTLFALLRELGGIAVPHHVAWTGADFAHHDPSVQPVWEICSVHGCYEAEGACPAHPPRADHVIPGHFVRDALAAGLRFGFIGSTDSHGLDWHHGIARWRNPFRAGLACVVGAQPTRDGIIGALRARRSYATTGAKIVLRVEIDGAPMGSELPAGTPGELYVEAHGTAPISRVAMVEPAMERGGSTPARGSDREVALAVDTSGARARVRTRLPAGDGTRCLYVRVEQADGEAAWASPFWIGGA